MIRALNLWNFPTGQAPALAEGKDCFELRTCQRTLVLSYDERPFGAVALPLHERAEGKGAYLFLLETICGLKSRLLGENEIVAQFKEAYHQYLTRSEREARLLLVLEKLFKDAKEIRTAHMVGLGLKTYASITRRHFAAHKAEEILILGSGQLAEDLINQFKKRSRVLVSARNSERLRELVEQHKVTAVPWENKQLWEDQALIANTIGFEGTLLDQSFFDGWVRRHPLRLMVDLGSPSCLHTDLTIEQGLLKLNDILAEGAMVEEQKYERLVLARHALHEVVDKRVRWLEERGRKWHASAQLASTPAEPALL